MDILSILASSSSPQKDEEEDVQWIKDLAHKCVIDFLHFCDCEVFYLNEIDYRIWFDGPDWNIGRVISINPQVIDIQTVNGLFHVEHRRIQSDEIAFLIRFLYESLLGDLYNHND